MVQGTGVCGEYLWFVSDRHGMTDNRFTPQLQGFIHVLVSKSSTPRSPLEGFIVAESHILNHDDVPSIGSKVSKSWIPHNSTELRTPLFSLNTPSLFKVFLKYPEGQSRTSVYFDFSVMTVRMLFFFDLFNL